MLPSLEEVRERLDAHRIDLLTRGGKLSTSCLLEQTT
jgi:hypothetical protein